MVAERRRIRAYENITIIRWKMRVETCICPSNVLRISYGYALRDIRPANKDIDRLVHTCKVCQEHQPSQTPEPLLQHDIPSKPWSVLGTDLFEFEGHQWLIIADYYTKYPIIKQLPTPSPSSVVVNVTKQIFAEFGIPDRIVSDNGPHFGSEAYRDFARAWLFDHVTTSPRRPKGNGFIERQVRTIKSLLNKSKQSGTEYQLALLHWRTTPINANLASPGQLIMGRRLKTTILSELETPYQMKMMCTLSYSDDRSHRNAILIDAHDLLTCLFFIPASTFVFNTR